jgi:hypothetical protein
MPVNVTPSTQHGIAHFDQLIHTLKQSFDCHKNSLCQTHLSSCWGSTTDTLNLIRLTELFEISALSFAPKANAATKIPAPASCSVVSVEVTATSKSTSLMGTASLCGPRACSFRLVASPHSRGLICEPLAAANVCASFTPAMISLSVSLTNSCNFISVPPTKGVICTAILSHTTPQNASKCGRQKGTQRVLFWASLPSFLGPKTRMVWPFSGAFQRNPLFTIRCGKIGGKLTHFCELGADVPSGPQRLLVNP